MKTTQGQLILAQLGKKNQFPQVKVLLFPWKKTKKKLKKHPRENSHLLGT